MFSHIRRLVTLGLTTSILVAVTCLFIWLFRSPLHMSVENRLDRHVEVVMQFLGSEEQMPLQKAMHTFQLGSGERASLPLITGTSYHFIARASLPEGDISWAGSVAGSGAFSVVVVGSPARIDVADGN